MPYFWRRRWRRPYTRYRRRWTRPYRRPRYRRFRAAVRRRYRRYPYRRRRVRRKKKALLLKQWQPEHIRKCKIKGKTPLIICGEGRQQWNFTQHRYEITPGKMAGGGGFANLVWNLGFLYEEHTKWRNFWTTPNEGFDLARYTGTTLRIFRPPSVDVVLTITTNYPMLTNMGSHPACHPQRLLLGFKKYVIQSQKRQPNKKKYKVIKIKPPQLMQNKWFFQKDLAKLNLFQMYVSTCDLDRPYCSINGDNNSIGFWCLNTNVFKTVAWKKTVTNWSPDGSNILYGYIKTGSTTKKYQLKPTNIYGPSNLFYKNYLMGISKVYKSTTITTIDTSGKTVTQIPENSSTETEVSLTTYCRYNPLPDTGDNCILWLLTMLRADNTLNPSENFQFKLAELPLWLICYGFYDWMIKLHKNYPIMSDYVTCFTSDYVWSEIKLPDEPALKKPVYIPVGQWFINGYGLFQTEIPAGEYTDYVLRSSNQSPVLNDIVKSGPFIASPFREDSWCVEMTYTSYFKWGGTAPPQQDVVDPETQAIYPTPGDLSQRLQVKDPRKQTELHPWHFRRDIITKKALKRIRQDSENETDIESFTEKKKKTQSEVPPYIQGDLYSDQETSSGTESSQESNSEIEDIQQCLKQQRRKQHRLRKLIYRALVQLKRRQRHLSILTGPIE
nr:MAG: ORF1 [Torque teno midi virus]